MHRYSPRKLYSKIASEVIFGHVQRQSCSSYMARRACSVTASLLAVNHQKDNWWTYVFTCVLPCRLVLWIQLHLVKPSTSGSFVIWAWESWSILHCLSVHVVSLFNIQFIWMETKSSTCRYSKVPRYNCNANGKEFIQPLILFLQKEMILMLAHGSCFDEFHLPINVGAQASNTMENL